MTNTDSRKKISSKAGYDLWSKSYDEYHNPMIAMVDYALERTPVELEGMKALELGCGTGRNLDVLLRAGATNVIGIDNSVGMLTEAQAKYTDARVKLIDADLSKPLPLKNASVDFVFCALVMEHMPALLPILKEIRRVLRPTGRARILEIHSDLVNGGTQAHFLHEGEELYLPSFAHDEAEWKKAITTSGMQLHAYTELLANDMTISRNEKLAKHLGSAVLVDLEIVNRP